MARAMLLLLPMMCVMPMTAEAGDESQSRAEKRSCVDLPPMAKSKKCRELPAMAAPDDGDRARRRMRVMEIRAFELQKQRAAWVQTQVGRPR